MTPAEQARGLRGVAACRKILAALRGADDEFPGVTERQNANEALRRATAVR